MQPLWVPESGGIQLLRSVRRATGRERCTLVQGRPGSLADLSSPGFGRVAPVRSLVAVPTTAHEVHHPIDQPARDHLYPPACLCRRSRPCRPSAGSGQRRSSRDSIGCGPRTIAGVFEMHNIPCQIQRVEEILNKRALLRKFGHVAISAMTMDIPAVTKFVKLWRGSRSQGRILIGGPISADPLALRELNPDVIVRGEGEATLDELITKKVSSIDKF